MIPLSLAPANSAERSRGLLFSGAVLKLQGCRGFEGEKENKGWEKKKRKTSPDLWCKVSERGQLLHYTCLARIIFMTHTGFFAANKQNFINPFEDFFSLSFGVVCEKHPVQQQSLGIRKESRCIQGAVFKTRTSWGGLVVVSSMLHIQDETEWSEMRREMLFSNKSTNWVDCNWWKKWGCQRVCRFLCVWCHQGALFLH